MCRTRSSVSRHRLTHWSAPNWNMRQPLEVLCDTEEGSCSAAQNSPAALSTSAAHASPTSPTLPAPFYRSIKWISIFNYSRRSHEYHYLFYILYGKQFSGWNNFREFAPKWGRICFILEINSGIKRKFSLLLFLIWWYVWKYVWKYKSKPLLEILCLILVFRIESSKLLA